MLFSCCLICFHVNVDQNVNALSHILCTRTASGASTATPEEKKLASSWPWWNSGGIARFTKSALPKWLGFLKSRFRQMKMSRASMPSSLATWAAVASARLDAGIEQIFSRHTATPCSGNRRADLLWPAFALGSFLCRAAGRQPGDIPAVCAHRFQTLGFLPELVKEHPWPSL